MAGDYRNQEKAAVQKLLTRLTTLKTSLAARLLAADLTDFRRYTLTQLVADVDRLVADAQAQITADTKATYTKAVDLGANYAENPLAAAQLNVNLQAGLPGLDAVLVQAAFDNTADLLTQPMQQFRTDVVTNLRRVAMAGDGRQAAINQLRDTIQAKGFSNAAYRAERIVRTELGRVFNQATYARMLQLEKDFPFLRKGWRATGDGRTRMGHREAGKRYARGSGIRISDLFTLNVYQEATGRGAKGKGKVGPKIGEVRMRFPQDPETQPQGRLSAASTIMCRCNAFVDFDVAEFAAFSQAKVQTALTGVTPPATAPPAPPPPAPPPIPKAAKPKVPRVPKPKVVRGKPAGQVTAPAVVPKKKGPAGPAVGAALFFKMDATTAIRKKVAAAIALIDQVHGDGNLPKIPIGKPSKGTRGAAAYYMSSGGRAIELGFGAKILGQSPLMGSFHEIGHFLDHQGLGAGQYGGWGSTSTAATGTDPRNQAVFQAIQQLQGALANSRTMQSLKRFLSANVPGSGFAMGDGVIPKDYNPLQDRKFVNYMTSAKETFARAYAQYIAVKSGDAAALAELRATQQAAKQFVDGVPADYRHDYVSPMGQQVGPKGWSFPWAWQDDDFKAVQDAFDHLFDTLGWVK